MSNKAVAEEVSTISSPQDDNPFTKPENAAVWIKNVEGERGSFRDLFIYPRLEAWDRTVEDGPIVEIGCGQGICSPHISHHRRYVGVEPSLLLLRRAVELYGSDVRSFVAGTSYSLPLVDGKCSGAFSVNVWMHISNLDAASTELARVLAPGGKFLIVTANPDNYKKWEELHFGATRVGNRIQGGFHLPGADLPEHIFFTHSLESIASSLERACLQLNSVEAFGRESSEDRRDWFVAFSGSKL